MKDIWTVFCFTLRDGLRKKAFIITTVVVLVVILIACALPGLLGGMDSPGEEPSPSDTAKTGLCFVADEQGVIPGAVEALAAAYPQIDFQPADAARLEDAKARVEQDKTVSAVEILPGTPVPQLTVYTHDFMSGIPSGDVARVLKEVYICQLLAQSGLPEQTAQAILAPMAAQSVMLGRMDLSGYVVGILLTMVIFFAVNYYGYGVAMSVASEKTSRVMETLVVSAKPSRILLGKCLAMGALGLLQLSLFLVTGGLGFALLVPDGFTIGGMPLALTAFTPVSALLVLLYFLLGYALYAMLNSVCGATVSRTEDLNAAMMPTVLITAVSFYAAYMTILIPGDSFKRVVTYIPFTSPFIMPFRLLNEAVPAGDIALSLLLLVAAIVLIASLSIRIYSASVLHYGRRLKLTDLMKLRT